MAKQPLTDTATQDEWRATRAALEQLPPRRWQPQQLARVAGLETGRVGVVFEEHRHTTARVGLTEARGRAARQQLLSSAEPVETVAAACGLTVRALNRNLLDQTGLDCASTRSLLGAPNFTLRLPPRFRVAETMAYLTRDPRSLNIRGSGDRAFAFGLAIGERAVSAVCQFDADATELQVEVLQRGRQRDDAAIHVADALARMLGLASGTKQLENLARREELMRRLIGPRRGMRIPLTAAPVDALTWSILGQQINLPFAYELLRTTTALCGLRAPERLYTMPIPARIAQTPESAFTSRKMSRSKARYLVDIASAAASGTLNLTALAEGSFATAYETLTALRGIGPWTANYTLMRGLGFADCAPIGDAGLRRALRRFDQLETPPDDAEMVRLMARFRPFRSLATFHLWRGSDDALPTG